MGDADVWKYLHDGTIDRIEGSLPGDVEVHVSIQYLRQAFAPAGEGFVLRLRECARFDLTSDDGHLHDDLAQIAALGPEILSVVQELPLQVYCTFGTLHLDYASVSLSLDTGEAISIDDLDRANAAYWGAWSARRGEG